MSLVHNLFSLLVINSEINWNKIIIKMSVNCKKIVKLYKKVQQELIMDLFINAILHTKYYLRLKLINEKRKITFLYPLLLEKPAANHILIILIIEF